MIVDDNWHYPHRQYSIYYFNNRSISYNLSIHYLYYKNKRGRLITINLSAFSKLKTKTKTVASPFF